MTRAVRQARGCLLAVLWTAAAVVHETQLLAARLGRALREGARGRGALGVRWRWGR